MQRWKAQKVTPFADLTIGTAIWSSGGRLRTVADGCGRLRTVEQRPANTAQPPQPQSETGTLATHWGKKLDSSFAPPMSVGLRDTYSEYTSQIVVYGFEHQPHGSWIIYKPEFHQFKRLPLQVSVTSLNRLSAIQMWQ